MYPSSFFPTLPHKWSELQCVLPGYWPDYGCLGPDGSISPPRVQSPPPRDTSMAMGCGCHPLPPVWGGSSFFPECRFTHTPDVGLLQAMEKLRDWGQLIVSRENCFPKLTQPGSPPESPNLLTLF